jgi:hypothetical protein
MTAAGREGIPCTFVIDKTRQIAYIGHPMYLDHVLPKIVAGTPARAMGAEMARTIADFSAVAETAARDRKAGLLALTEFEAKYPALADFLPAMRMRLSALPKHGKPGEAKAYAEALLARAVKKNDMLTLGMMSSILRRGDGKESKDLLALAVKAAQAEVRIAGGKDALTLLNLADTYSVSGDQARAKEYAQKAIDAVADESPELKQYIEKEARRLGADGQRGVSK